MPLLLLSMLLLAVSPGISAASPGTLGGIELEQIEGSSYLSTAWQQGYGPRLPPPLAAKAALEPLLEPRAYPPTQAVDKDPATAWAPEGDGVEAWLRLDMGTERFVEALTLSPYTSGQDPLLRTANEAKLISISAPNNSVDIPTRSFELEEGKAQHTLALGGHVYRALTLTVEQVYQNTKDPLAIAEIGARLLPIEPAAIRAALDIPEESAMSAIRSPANAAEHIVAWSGIIDGRLQAELVGISGRGASTRVLWREPVSLQWRGATSVDLKLERVSFGGPPALQLTYRFMEIGSTLAFARVYVLGSRGAQPAWETSLIGDLGGQRTRDLRFAGGRALISEHNEDLGYRMVQEVFRYDPSYRQFEPAPNQQPGSKTTISGGKSPGPLYDGLESTAVTVPGDGVGTQIKVRFDQPRRISAVQMSPGMTNRGGDGAHPQHTRPAKMTLSWPGGYSIEAEVEDATELQTIFEGWDGPASEPTRELTITITSVYPALPGNSMAISRLEIYTLDRPN